MKTKVILLCVMVILTSLDSFAQLDSFDLSKYKLSDYKRHSLDFSLYSSAYNNTYKANYDGFNAKSSDDFFNSNFSISYNFISNTRKKQQLYSIRSYVTPLNYNYYKSTDYNYFQKDESRSSQFQVNYNMSNFFYKQNEIFFSIGMDGNNAYLKNKTIHFNNNPSYPTDNTVKNSGLYLDNSVILGVGIGRIENAEDARLAIYILDELLKNNSINRKPADEEILLMASKITQLKNKRFFDYRLRRIIEIQTLDTFLHQSNLLNKQDVVYFTTLNDNWLYSNCPTRTSGDRFSINIKPFFNYNESKNSNSNYGVSANKRLGGKLYGEYLNSKPLNLKWQRNYNLQVGYQKLKNLYNNSNIIDYSTDQIYTSAKLEVGFYPNSRSYLTAFLENTLSKDWVDITLGDDKQFNYNLYASISAYYYFSERLNAYLNTNILLYYTKYDSNSYIRNSIDYHPEISIAMNYALF